MPKKQYCNIIGMTNGTLQTNVLLIGGADKIGDIAEQKALEVFKNLCSLMSDELRKKIKRGKSILDIQTLSNMYDEGILESECGVKVFIVWPEVIKLS